MKQKIIRFFVAFVLYSALYSLLLYFFDDSTDLNSLIKQTLFYGFAMAIFDLLILPRIIKKINNEPKKRTIRRR